MSSIVSRRPSSRNHRKEAFWMSIRLGRSRTCLRREKLLRARGAATGVVNGKVPPLSKKTAAGFTNRRTWAQPARVPDQGSQPQGCPCGDRRDDGHYSLRARKKKEAPVGVPLSIWREPSPV